MKKRWETIATTHRTLKDQSHDGTSSKSTMTSKPTATTITTVAETIPTTYTVIIIHRCTSSMSRFFVVNATTSLPYCWGSHVMLIRTTCDCGSFENSWPGPTAAKHRLNFMMEASYILKYNLWIVNSHLDSFHLVSIHNNISKKQFKWDHHLLNKAEVRANLRGDGWVLTDPPTCGSRGWNYLGMWCNKRSIFATPFQLHSKKLFPEKVTIFHDIFKDPTNMPCPRS